MAAVTAAGIGALQGVYALDQIGAAPRNTAAIVGQVRDTTNQPVARATVRIVGLESRGLTSPAMTTDDEGDFYFRDLPAGQFQLEATKPGYLPDSDSWSAVSDRTGLSVTLASSERRLDVVLIMRKSASVSGAVRDADGAPFDRASVSAYRRRIVSGRPRYETAVGSMSNGADERGIYRDYWLNPGAYLFVARASRPARLNSTAAAPQTVWFSSAYPMRPGDYEPARTLSPGEELSGIDFELLPIHGVRVTGMTLGNPYSGPVEISFFRDVEARYASALADVPASTRIQPDGHFVFDGVPPGRYTIRAIARPPFEPGPPSEPQGVFRTAGGGLMTTYGPGISSSTRPPARPVFVAERSLFVGTDDMDEITLTLQQSLTIHGRLVFDGTSPPPEGDRLRYTQVHIEPEDGANFGRGQAGASVAEDGSFAIRDVMPGRYAIRATAAMDPWVLRAATAAGQDLSLLSFDVAKTDCATSSSRSPTGARRCTARSRRTPRGERRCR